MAKWYGFCREYQGGAPMFIVEARSCFAAVMKIMAYCADDSAQEEYDTTPYLGDVGFEIREEGQCSAEDKAEWEADDENIRIV